MKGRRDAGVTDTVRQGRSQGTQGRQAARDWKMLMVNLVYSVYSVAVFKRDKRTSSLVNAVNMRIARAPVLAAAERPRETETPWQKPGTARRAFEISTRSGSRVSSALALPLAFA